MAVDPNIKIVVADDSGTMRIMFKQILNKAGFENFVMAVNGEDGLEKVKAEKSEQNKVTPKYYGLDHMRWICPPKHFALE